MAATENGYARLDGKVAIVFGVSPNIGGTCAHFLARQGARLALCDVRREAAEEAAEFFRGRGFEAIVLVGDSSDEATAAGLVAQAVKHYGKIDIMLNLVGNQYRDEVLDFNLHDWERQLKGYLTGGMLTTKHVARSMQEHGVEGSIIHIISDAGHQGEPGNAGYSAAKGGLLNYARAAAMELARYRIRVNTVSPTFVDHLLWTYPLEWLNPRIHGPSNLSADDFIQGIPLGRFCTATDIANAVVFLASDASAFLTGVDIPLDGGARTKYWPWSPGKWSGVNTDQYVAQMKVRKYGVPVDELKKELKDDGSTGGKRTN
ncbi:MAG: SDR family oxidoreductase [Candidatus Binataceae bacterium]|nr:SDR family oxidoreductase [Candidatus Binataceae bacterium]